MSARGFARLCWLVAVIVVFVSPTQAQQPPATALSKAQLEQLVAPIALHPDALLSQMLMASTYPTEVVQAARWRRENPGISGQALEDAMQKQPWDPSVKALAAVPQSLQMMNDKLDWTQRLGDAFLAQQEDLLAAVQGLRQRAEASGNLKSTEQVKVSKSPAPATGGPTTGGKGPAIVIESSTPDYMYVPVYDPKVCYGDWPYSDYEPFYWYPEGYVGSGVLSWAAGIAIGAAIWGNADWWRGRVDIDVNRYNRFNRTNIVNKEWNHNPRHRGNVPYRDAHVAQRFGDGNRAAARDAFRGKAETGRRDLATKAGAAAAAGAAGAAAAGAAAKARAGAAAKSRPAATPTKHAGKAKAAAKTKSAAHTNRAKSAKNASRAAGSKQASRTRQASRPRATPHRAQARARSPVRHAQRHAFRPSMGGRGGGFRASGFRGGGFRGGGGRGGGGRGGGRRSDVALKHDIVLLGHLDNGLGFYRFAYNGSNQAYVGVLAQEVQKVRPEAVVRGSDGYLRVHYDQLGLKFQTYRLWTASGAQIPGR